MACMTLTAQQVAMATTQLLQAADQVVEITWPVVVRREPNPLEMRWVVAIDENGKHLHMNWQAASVNEPCVS